MRVSFIHGILVNRWLRRCGNEHFLTSKSGFTHLLEIQGCKVFDIAEVEIDSLAQKIQAYKVHFGGTASRLTLE